MTPMNLQKFLKDQGACREAIQWASSYVNPEKAWNDCPRGDWMLWIVGRLSGPPENDLRKRLVLCACECARLSLPIYENKHLNDNRVRDCIEVAERWAKNEATIKELKTARHAAAYAAYAAAYAAYAAASAADAYAAYAARNKTLANCADIVRKHYTFLQIKEMAGIE